MSPDNVERNVRKVLSVLQVLKPLSVHCTVNTAIAFLTIGSQPGITVGAIQKTLGLQPTSTARALSILYKRSRGIEGLDLVETKISLQDGRIKHLHLTPKGMRVWNQITQILGG